MRITWPVFYKKELFTLHEHLGSPPVFGDVLVVHLFLLCLHPVSCVPNVPSISELPLQFSLTFIYRKRKRNIAVFSVKYLMK